MSHCFVDSANADDRFWIGGNANWNDGAGVGFWTANDEPDPDDVAIFNTNNNVTLGTDNEVDGLTLSGGMSLFTDDQFLDVNGDITLSDNGTLLGVGGNNVVGVPVNGLDAENITINAGARLSIGGTQLDTIAAGVDEALIDINGGTLSGNGTIDNNDGSTTAFVMLRNDGTLSVANFSTGFVIIGGTPAARTLNITATDVEARVDLDGTSGGGIVNVFRNQTLDIDVTLNDAFDGSLNLFHESRLDIADAWTISGGTTTIDNGFAPGIFPFPSTPAGNATIAGGLLTQTGGTIDVVDSDGTLTFEANFTGTGGTLDNSAGGTVIFQGTTTLNNAHGYLLGSNSQTVVDGGTTTVNDDNLDFDGVNSTADWTVTNGGRLNVLKSSISGSGSNVLSGDLVFDGGQVNVNVDGSSWTSNGEIRSENGGKLIGDRVLIGNDIGTPTADLDIDGGTLTISAPVSLLSDARVNVAAGSTLIINSPDTIVAPVNGANNGSFTGSGNVFIRGAQFDEDTTLDFSGGTVGFDGTVGNNNFLFVIGAAAADTDINANVTVNAATFDDFGFTSFAIFPTLPTQSDLNIADSGSLTVNLDDANGSWTVLSNGIVNYNGDNAVGNFLMGSDINMNGTLNVNGDGRAQVLLDIGGTININTAGQFFRLNEGGGTHTLSGGLINGPGTLRAESNDNLSGNGVINADVGFTGTSDLIASGGLLDVNGAITDVGTLRSNGAAAVLDLAQAFNSNITGNGISVAGGRIQGNTITLDTRNLRGNGTVTNRLVVNSSVRAQGGELVIDNTSSDLDGVGNAGALVAQSGDLTIRDNGFVFRGTVQADAGRTVLADGFELEMNAASTLDLNGGTFQSTVSTDFFGSIDAAAGQTSRISSPGSDFNDSTTFQLNGDLELVDDAVIRSGVTAAGAGRLIAANFGALTINDGADLDVFLENQTEVQVAGATTGRIDLDDFLQTSTGAIVFDLETTALGDYDRVIVSGNADLAGEIILDKIGGGTFDAYDTVSLLSATAGVIDTFDTVAGVGDLGIVGQGLAVTYDATSVNLTRALLGDTDLDQTVDVFGDGFTLLANLGTLTGGTWAQGDFTGDGIIDVFGDGFALLGNLGTTFGAGAAPATSAVPEPGTMSLLMFAGLAAAVRRRRA